MPPFKSAASRVSDWIPIVFQVSWVRRKEEQLHLITFGASLYVSDSRYSLEYKPPNDWQLHIQYANERDEGQFECQINTSPPLVLVTVLEVIGKHPSSVPLSSIGLWLIRKPPKESSSSCQYLGSAHEFPNHIKYNPNPIRLIKRALQLSRKDFFILYRSYRQLPKLNLLLLRNSATLHSNPAASWRYLWAPRDVSSPIIFSLHCFSMNTGGAQLLQTRGTLCHVKLMKT